MNEALVSILCGEESWYFYREGRSIRFNSDGTGELLCRCELVQFICAEINWRRIATLGGLSQTNQDTTAAAAQKSGPQLLGEVELEITITKRLPKWVPPQAQVDYAKLNEMCLTDDAFVPKLYKVRIERGHFIEPIYYSSPGTTRYSHRLLFDKSPYPPRTEWREPRGGPDSNEFWNHKEFVGRKAPQLERQGRAMNDTSPWRWNECIVS
ncbi:hypothetical protein F5Y03DRAFT_360654 [Xylaria venustula]|nr:hypothetical protein F5Y03DRAFT_360654 [Xylaria venustula]